jgi:hypothetical protein
VALVEEVHRTFAGPRMPWRTAWSWPEGAVAATANSALEVATGRILWEVRASRY